MGALNVVLPLALALFCVGAFGVLVRRDLLGLPPRDNLRQFHKAFHWPALGL